METQKPLLKDEDDEEVDVHMHRSMIGSLMYLTSLRPDIMFAVCVCARYQVNPKVSHLHAMKRIFKYLKGQLKFGLWYPKDYPFDSVAYTDSDYARASLDRKSITEVVNFLDVVAAAKQPILNPNRIVDGVVQIIAPTTAEQRLAKKNKLKARGTLLMALRDKHRLKFNIYKDAKSLMEAIEKSTNESVNAAPSVSAASSKA
nr:uncharacterized mitochondrial protein AtMg00810-like [Tanacetum cinerariifolium]